MFLAVPGRTREAAARAAVEMLHPFGVQYFEYALDGGGEVLAMLDKQRSAEFKPELPMFERLYVRHAGCGCCSACMQTARA